jgi:hypothetical protein
LISPTIIITLYIPIITITILHSTLNILKIWPLLFKDSPYNYQIGFQEAASPSAEAIISFHNHVMVIIVVILSVVV